MAARYGHTKAVQANTLGSLSGVRETYGLQVLLKYGADVNVREDDGWMPLHMASSFGYSQIIQVCEVDCRLPPLYQMCVYLQALLDYGASIDTTGQKGWTALHLATRYGHTKAVEVSKHHIRHGPRHG